MCLYGRLLKAPADKQCNLTLADKMDSHQPLQLLYLVNRDVNSTLLRVQNTNSVLHSCQWTQRAFVALM